VAKKGMPEAELVALFGTGATPAGRSVEALGRWGCLQAARPHAAATTIATTATAAMRIRLYLVEQRSQMPGEASRGAGDRGAPQERHDGPASRDVAAAGWEDVCCAGIAVVLCADYLDATSRRKPTINRGVHGG